MTTNIRFPFAQCCLPPAVWRLVELALDEDLGRGDVTSEAMFSPQKTGQAVVLAKSELVLSGLDVAMAVFQAADSRVEVTPLFSDGSLLHPHTQVLRVEGRLRSILAAERTALNFLQRLCGVATLTRQFVQTIAGTQAKIVDTRKSAPGFRFLDKRAVRHGGGANHRADLGSGVLIKDNHVAAAGSVGQAIHQAREHAPHLLQIEAEITSLDQLSEAFAAGADVILLDNMSPEHVEQAISRLPPRGDARRPLIEVSGGVNLSTVRAYAEAGADLISVGALTHSVVAADLSLEVEI